MTNNMNFGEKLMFLRQAKGWSRRDMAEKTGVTEEVVGQWEEGVSQPSLKDLAGICRIFDVSADYLLDHHEETPTTEREPRVMKALTLARAEEFLEVKLNTAKKIALATFLCIISPISLIVLAVAAEEGYLAITENAAAGVGLIIMALLVTAAVAVFIGCGMKTKAFQDLETEIFTTGKEVEEMALERQRELQGKYSRGNILGACFCIISVVPIFLAAGFSSNDMAAAAAVAATLIIAGIGVVFFIIAGIPQATLEKILQQGDYTPENKKKANSVGAFSTVYWLLVTGIYLAWSFLSRNWDMTWILWPVAAVLYGAFITIVKLKFANR
ncbi:MAG: helix-turn-helix transcriptional regulator [Bacillota bacterium]|nr:helix-turn-helix transcriptional regulator [Bacillota bacterium]